MSAISREYAFEPKLEGPIGMDNAGVAGTSCRVPASACNEPNSDTNYSGREAIEKVSEEYFGRKYCFSSASTRFLYHNHLGIEIQLWQPQEAVG